MVKIGQHSKFRFGRIINLQGFPSGRDRWCWHTSIGLIRPRWKHGKWLGESSWKYCGPLAICRWRDPWVW